MCLCGFLFLFFPDGGLMELARCVHNWGRRESKQKTQGGTEEWQVERIPLWYFPKLWLQNRGLVARGGDDIEV